MQIVLESFKRHRHIKEMLQKKITEFIKYLIHMNYPPTSLIIVKIIHKTLYILDKFMTYYLVNLLINS